MTGLTDWSDTYGAERRVGLNHALFNVLAGILYLVSFVLRLLQAPGDSLLAAILGFVGLASVIYAAYLVAANIIWTGARLLHQTGLGEHQGIAVSRPQACRRFRGTCPR